MQSEVPGTSEGQVSSVMSARRYAEKFPWADIEAIDAFLTISRTFNALYLALLRRPMPGGSELSRAQHNFLAALYLADGNSLALSEIAREMNVTPTYVTKLSDSLEAEGLVERTASRSDRRVTYAHLTPEGLSRSAETVPAFLRFMEEVGQDITSAEKIELKRLLMTYHTRAEAILAALHRD